MMKKALKSSLALILALTMLLGGALSATASAASAKPLTVDVSVSDVQKFITTTVKTAVAAAKVAADAYDKYVPQPIKDANSAVVNNTVNGVKNLLSPTETIVTIDGKDYNITSVIGLISILGKLETEQQKKCVSMKYLELLFKKIIQFIADVLPMPNGMAKLEDYKPESENFYKGHKTFAKEAAANAKWQLGYSQASLVPDDVLNGNYYLGGYLLQNFPSNTVETVLDDMKVRTVVLDDGRGKVVFSTIESIGLANADVKKIREKVEEKLKGENIVSVNIFTTHCHSCIDTQGLWYPFFTKIPQNIITSILGKDNYKTGTDPKYMEFLFTKTVDTIVEACKNMETGDLYEATKYLGEDYIFDKRGVFDAVSNLTRLRFVPDNADSKETYIVNMSAHPYVTGLKTDKSSGKELSADYTYYMEQVISSAENNNTNFMFINGALCGIYSGRSVTNDGIPTERRSEEATRYGTELGRMVIGLTMTKEQIKAAGNWLSDDDRAAEQAALGNEDFTLWYEDWTPVKETKVEPILNIRHKEVLAPITNPIIEAAGKTKLVNNKMYLSKDNKLYTTTEIGYLEIGKNIKVMLAPGEISPELITGKGSCLAENAYTGQAFGYPSIEKIVSDYCGKDTKVLVFGEANDACGYIVPDNDYCMIFFDDSEQFGDHYQESISFGEHTASIIVTAYEDMMKGLK